MSTTIDRLNQRAKTVLVRTAHHRFKRISLCSLVLLPLSVGVSGCISSSNPPPPPSNTTIVVPSGSAVICSDGSYPPCR